MHHSPFILWRESMDPPTLIPILLSLPRPKPQPHHYRYLHTSLIPHVQQAFNSKVLVGAS
jgi:hypothetical protein